jgi:hypothetical protein
MARAPGSIAADVASLRFATRQNPTVGRPRKQAKAEVQSDEDLTEEMVVLDAYHAWLDRGGLYIKCLTDTISDKPDGNGDRETNTTNSFTDIDNCAADCDAADNSNSILFIRHLQVNKLLSTN